MAPDQNGSSPIPTKEEAHQDYPILIIDNEYYEPGGMVDITPFEILLGAIITICCLVFMGLGLIFFWWWVGT